MKVYTCVYIQFRIYWPQLDWRTRFCLCGTPRVVWGRSLFVCVSICTCHVFGCLHILCDALRVYTECIESKGFYKLQYYVLISQMKCLRALVFGMVIKAQQQQQQQSSTRHWKASAHEHQRTWLIRHRKLWYMCIQCMYVCMYVCVFYVCIYYIIAQRTSGIKHDWLFMQHIFKTNFNNLFNIWTTRKMIFYESAFCTSALLFIIDSPNQRVPGFRNNMFG